MERLQKIIAKAGLASRREAEKFILAGKVMVDGKIITELGYKADLAENVIMVDGEQLQKFEKRVYYVFYKPIGCISTAKDEQQRRTVLDYFPVQERVYPVGRLDYNTSGLLLVTNDGVLMNGLLHPKYKIDKTYSAWVEGEIDEAKLTVLSEGVQLEDGITAPAVVKVCDRRPNKNLLQIEITIHEGRNRQVRRMFSAIGCRVVSLERIEFAGLTLFGMKPGHYRALTPQEIKCLYNLALQ